MRSTISGPAWKSTNVCTPYRGRREAMPHSPLPLIVLATVAGATEHATTAARLANEIGMALEMTLIGDYTTAAGPITDVDPEIVSPAKLAMQATLQRQGDVWCVGLENEAHLIRHSKGLEYLERLIEHPSRDWYVLDLYSLVAGKPVLDETGTGPGLDSAAREAYRARYLELSDRLDRSIETADLGTSDATRVEIELLEAELVGAFGLGGRPRSSPGTAEKARVNVRRSLSRAISSISSVKPCPGRPPGPVCPNWPVLLL